VDDSPLQLDAARNALAERYEVVAFESGSAMIERLALNRPPNVLILDWHMPDLSGVEVCQFVRSKLDLAQLPILILTATSDGESLLEALAAGANDFVRKPFSDEELNARVSALARTGSLHARLLETESRLRLEAEFRERFIGMLAHDLRQPLNTMFMAGQLIERASSIDELGKLPSMQLRAAGRMRRMIIELLDFTRNRPETGIPLQRQAVDLAEVARASVDEFSVAQPEHPLRLSVAGDCTGFWDADRLAQICSNLISNAIEHSSAGAAVDVALREGVGGVELRVTNQGEAIPEQLGATLFQPFRRGPRKGSKGGVGLGLYIVHQIVSLHGGTISVQSDAGGTHFLVILPSSAPPSA
jgi:signal transduction histidine kinase